MSGPSFYLYNTPIGKVTIGCDGQSITRLAPGSVSMEGVFSPSEVTNRAANELQEYLAGNRRYFDVSINPAGTRFQRAVWTEMMDVPYGSTRTYSQVARAIGSPNAYRAVGMAANRNPIPIIIPCHRIVGANGKLVGYALGLDVKRYLLDLEREACK